MSPVLTVIGINHLVNNVSMTLKTYEILLGIRVLARLGEQIYFCDRFLRA